MGAVASRVCSCRRRRRRRPGACALRLSAAPPCRRAAIPVSYSRVQTFAGGSSRAGALGGVRAWRGARPGRAQSFRRAAHKFSITQRTADSLASLLSTEMRSRRGAILEPMAWPLQMDGMRDL